MKKFDSLFIKGISVILVPIITISIFAFLVTYSTTSKGEELNDPLIESEKIIYDTVKIKKIVYDTITISIKPKEKPISPSVDVKIDTTTK